MRILTGVFTGALVTAAGIVAPCLSCSDQDHVGPADAGTLPPLDADALPPPGTFCSLPGSVVQTDAGAGVVPGSDGAVPDLGWLHLPSGFCAHSFANVKTARQLKFAPGGDLFVASPTRPTTGGASDGISGVVVLPDDNHDGVADSNITFLSGVIAVQGLMFTDGFFYYQDQAIIRRVPFAQGDRQPSGASQVVADMTSWPQDALHWPKVFDRAKDGTIYISNGGSQVDDCVSTNPVRGGIFKLNADGSTTPVATGFRNPIAIRCEATQNTCLAIELALDYSASDGGREKLLPIRQGDDWGFPCCATRNLPYTGTTYSDTHSMPDCSGVAAETASFIIADTPFGLDFETGRWPQPWTGRAFVTLHGAFQTWKGSRIVAVALDPTTGAPLQASELPGTGADPANMLEFATGWDDGRLDHGRPAPVAFAPDGRMFLGDDVTGAIIWIAPVGLTP